MVKTIKQEFFFGIVEDINDPKENGRYRVRVYGYHTQDKSILPTENLKWFYTIVNNSIATAGVGISATNYEVGTAVFGMWLGNDYQDGIIIGGISSNTNNENDVPQLARSEDVLTEMKEVIWKEPSNPYNAKYPHNQVNYTKSGHAIEIDDTEGSERIHIHHRTGSYIEIYPDGQVKHRNVNNTWEITSGNKGVYVDGENDVEITGNSKVLIKGNCNLIVNGNVEETISGSKKSTIDGSYDIKVSGNYKVNASRIDLN